MKHKKIVVAALAAATLVIAGLAVWLYINNKHVNNDNASTPQVIGGRITGISNECQADGTCSVTLDGSKLIVTGCGLMANGKTCKSYDQTKLHTGQQVQATVTKNQAGLYDLECDSCTIRVVHE